MKTKICSKCKERKPISSFAKGKSYKNGIRPWCKSCVNKYARKWHKSHPSRKKNYNLKYTFGIDLKQQGKMYIEQKGCCAICGEPIPYDKINTDHNHQIGQVRDLLCNRCNVFVGYVENYPELLDTVLDYLRFHNDK